MTLFGLQFSLQILLIYESKFSWVLYNVFIFGKYRSSQFHLHSSWVFILLEVVPLLLSILTHFVSMSEVIIDEVVKYIIGFLVHRLFSIHSDVHKKTRICYQLNKIQTRIQHETWGCSCSHIRRAKTFEVSNKTALDNNDNVLFLFILNWVKNVENKSVKCLFISIDRFWMIHHYFKNVIKILWIISIMSFSLKDLHMDRNEWNYAISFYLQTNAMMKCRITILYKNCEMFSALNVIILKRWQCFLTKNNLTRI